MAPNIFCVKENYKKIDNVVNLFEQVHEEIEKIHRANKDRDS